MHGRVMELFRPFEERFAGLAVSVLDGVDALDGELARVRDFDLGIAGDGGFR